MKQPVFVTIVATSLFLAACSDSFSPESVAGLYELVSVDGNPLPYTQDFTLQELTVEMTFTAATITLNDDGTFNTSMTLEISSGELSQSETWTSSGTYTLSDPPLIQFEDDIDDEVLNGSLEGDRLTVIDVGATLVYER